MLQTWFYLAIAHNRLGHAEEGRRWLDKTVQGTQQALKSPAELPGKSGNPNGVIPRNWNRKLTLQLLRREAGQLIQARGTKLSQRRERRHDEAGKRAGKRDRSDIEKSGS